MKRSHLHPSHHPLDSVSKHPAPPPSLLHPTSQGQAALDSPGSSFSPSLLTPEGIPSHPSQLSPSARSPPCSKMPPTRVENPCSASGPDPFTFHENPGLRASGPRALAHAVASTWTAHAQKPTQTHRRCHPAEGARPASLGSTTASCTPGSFSSAHSLSLREGSRCPINTDD